MITGDGNHFEDFAVGDVIEHARGRTIDQMENLMITHLTLNTAQPHVNVLAARELGFGFTDALVMGGFTTALVIGLTSEDMSENAIADLGLDGLRLTNPVYPGDTLFARSEVIALEPAERPGAGILTYRFTGRKSDGTVVAEGVRRVLVKRRGARP